MIPAIFFLEKFRRVLKKNFIKVLFALAIVITYGTFSEYYLERNVNGTGVTNLFNSLWFVVQTITTVGYGDTPVIGFWGRINAMVLMLVGIGILGLFTASLASVMMDYSLQKLSGNISINRRDHVVICNWNPVAKDVILQLNKLYPYIVLLSPEEKSPTEEVIFVKGTCLHTSDLEKANVKNAKTVIILSEVIVDGDLASAYDAKTILGVMNVRKLSKNVHIVVELLKEDSSENAKMAGANELIIKGKVSSRLISKGSIYPGSIEVIDHLLASKSGLEIVEEPLPDWAKGKVYANVVKQMIEKNVTCIGIKDKNGIKLNPSPDYILSGGNVICIKSDKR